DRRSPARLMRIYPARSALRRACPAAAWRAGPARPLYDAEDYVVVGYFRFERAAGEHRGDFFVQEDSHAVGLDDVVAVAGPRRDEQLEPAGGVAVDDPQTGRLRQVRPAGQAADGLDGGMVQGQHSYAP